MTIENQDFDHDEVTQQAETLHPIAEAAALDHSYEPDFEQKKLEDAVAFMEAQGIAKAEADLAKPAEANTSTDKKEKRETLQNSGSMFKNDKKTTTSHPDITGSALVGGAEYWVSGWRKSGAKGDFYSLSFKPKDAPAASSDLI